MSPFLTVPDVLNLAVGLSLSELGGQNGALPRVYLSLSRPRMENIWTVKAAANISLHCECGRGLNSDARGRLHIPRFSLASGYCKGGREGGGKQKVGTRLHPCTDHNLSGTSFPSKSHNTRRTVAPAAAEELRRQQQHACAHALLS